MVELVLLDRRRVGRPAGSAERAQIDAIVEVGSAAYQEVLSGLHAGRSEPLRPEIVEWLRDSEAANRRSGGVRGILDRGRFQLTPGDYARLDRKHPELSYSGGEQVSDVAADPEIDRILQAVGGDDFERLAVAWIAHLAGVGGLGLGDIRRAVGRLEDAAAGRTEGVAAALAELRSRSEDP